ncbi:hypothetical protein [Oryzihumus leptocrescens]|uniref:hypothetical protein n=1 Tax=Oryzihumus leptocrescens TaxID=297536 RepID=UPI00114F795E|nr:hypothetical protein [Oryzihumus leptocrescens]
MTWASPPRVTPVPPQAGGFTGCARDSQGQQAEGVTWSYWAEDRWDSSTQRSLPPYALPGSARYTCLYPPRYTDQPINCAVALSATIDRSGNPNWALDGRVASRSAATAFSRSHALSDCGGSWRLDLAVPLDAWGRYSASAVSTAVSCIERVFTSPDPHTGRIPPAVIVGACSAPFTVSPASARAQSDCVRAARQGWDYSRDWSFTTADCPAGRSPAKCAVGGTPTLLLPTGAVVRLAHLQMMDDGRHLTATWPTPKVTGSTRVYSTSTTLERVSGTPWKGQAPLDEQPFVADLGSPRTGLIPGPWSEAWQSAGSPGKPTVTHLRYRVDAEWATTEGVITGLDTRTGAVSVGSRPGTVRARGVCLSGPLAVDVYYARNSNN